MDTITVTRAIEAPSGSDIEAQRALELEAVTEHRRRLDEILKRARERGTESQTPIGSALVKRLLVPVANCLSGDLDKLLSGQAVEGGAGLRLLYDLDPLRIAAIAIRAAIDFKSFPRAATETAGYIGRALEEEYLWRLWEKANAREARHVREKVNERTNARVQRKARGGYARRLQPEKVASKEWSEHTRLNVGYRFIDYLVRCGLFRRTTMYKWRGKGVLGKPAIAVKLTDEAEQWSKDLTDLIIAARPISWPLIIPPVPWTSPIGGGFYGPHGINHLVPPRPVRPLNIVSGKASPAHRAAIANADLSSVYAGLNAAQATAWRINRRVYDVMAECIAHGIGPDDLALPDPKARPPRIDDGVWATMTEDQQRQHKREIWVIEEDNRKARRRRIEQHRLMRTAGRFVDYPSIYLAHRLDFRGRVYPVSPDLAPNGSDKEKALLEFSRGDVLTERGVFWLKVHVANTFGHDKVSFEDRVRWTEDNEALILSTARSPLDDTRWHAVGKKTRWQFLAACLAYEACKRGDPVCRVPVMLDGTCSGLQHWTAVLRDEKVAPFVNVIDTDKPGDLYSRVADRTITLLLEAAKRGEQWALEWATWKPDRSVLKPVVMGFPYGKSLMTTLDDVREAADKLAAEGKRPALNWLPEHAGRGAAYAVLAGYARKATMAEVERAAEGQRYVQQLVDEWRRVEPTRFMSWISPSGWPVVAEYRKAGEKSGQFETEIAGEPIKPRYSIGEGALDWPAARRAMPPNFIHSIDGAHVVLSLKRAAERGVDQLCAVHDAFGTTPSRTDELREALAETFVEVHRAEPLGGLARRLGEIGGTRLPTPPERGGLELEEVRRATYLFS